MPQARKTESSTVTPTVTTMYRDFASREHLTDFVDETVQNALAKFLSRHNTRVDVTLDLSEKRTRRKLFSVGITLHPAHKAPIHISRESEDLHTAIRASVRAVEKILRRDHARRLAVRRHTSLRDVGPMGLLPDSGGEFFGKGA